MTHLLARPAAIAGLLAAALFGAGFAVYWSSHGLVPEVTDWQGFQDASPSGTGEAVHTIRSYGSIVWAVPNWRPLRLHLWLRAPELAAGQHARLQLEADHTPLGTADLTSAWAAYEVAIDTPPSPLQKLTLEVTADVDGPIRGGVQLRGQTLATVLTPLAVARRAVTGALVGALVMVPLLLLPIAQPPAPVAGVRSRATLPTAMVTCGLLLYFGVWLFIKPPLSGPDEPQHLMRAAAILKTPWLAHLGTFPHDVRFLNPLALWHPPGLWKVIFPSAQWMSADDVKALKRAAWRPPSELQHLEIYHIALASYPTLYYWVVFAGGQSATSILGLTPYQSVYAYRAASVLAATGLWVLVYRLLRELFGDGRDTTTMFLFLVLNPMVGYLTSCVSADAFAIPLATLAVLACWRTLSTGTRVWSAAGWLLLGAFAKPSGLQIIASIAAVTLVLAMARRVPWRHALLTLIATDVAAVVAWLTFYAWSPTIFVGTPVTVDLPTYVLRFVQRLPEFWVYFWGLLGWMDYKLPDAWYAVLAGLVLLNVICLAWRPAPHPAFQRFALLLFVTYVASTATGEYLYLRNVGYVLQGRYFLPALVGLSALLLHRVVPARVSLLTCMAVMNVLLLHATVVRCFGGHYATLWLSLPFVPVK